MIDDLLADTTQNARRVQPTSSMVAVDPQKVAAVKISAEGMDSRVLNGMRTLLSEGRPPIVVWVYNSAHVKQHECSPDVLLKELLTHGYRLYFSGIYIYREQELARFLKNAQARTMELVFVAKGVQL